MTKTFQLIDPAAELPPPDPGNPFGASAWVFIIAENMGGVIYNATACYDYERKRWLIPTAGMHKVIHWLKEVHHD